METALFVFAGWILSICIHEFCHAIVAYWGGDTSVKDKGYLSFNVFRYTNPSITLIFPLIILALGGIALPGAAVFINEEKLRNRAWSSAVSLAGPLGSALTAVAYGAPLVSMPESSADPDWLRPALAFLTGLVVFSAYFNMIPFPPFDGYGVLRPWLPSSLRQMCDRLGNVGMLMMLAAMFWVPGFSRSLFDISRRIIVACGIPQAQYFAGAQEFEANTWTVGTILVIGLAIAARRKKKTDAADGQ